MGSQDTAGSSDQPHLSFNPSSDAPQSPEELKEEQRKLRRLQMMMDMVMSVIGQDATLTIDEAAEMVADSRRAALAMFPDKELAYDLIYKPRLQRLMRERYRIQ
jgi:excinuclease UvrABC helicase subunit UvrB